MRRWRSSSSIRTSVTARSSSAADSFHLRVLDDAGHGYDLVAAHDERPRLPLRAGHLRVDEHVLDLAPPTREPVAGPPSAHSKPLELGADNPLAPADLPGELDRAVLEPKPLVLAHRLEAAAEIKALRADGRSEQLGAEAGVLVRLLAAQLVVHVQRRDAVAQRAEQMPEAGRVGAARDETRHVAAGRDQLVGADEALDPVAQLLHPSIVPRRR